MIVGVILAAGKGSRMKTQGVNKTSLRFLEKPLVQYGVDLLTGIVERIILVVGAYHQSVVEVIDQDVSFAHQHKRLGTGHAVKVALKEIKNQQLSPTEVLVGYGDHMMFYTPEIIQQLIAKHQSNQAVISLISTEHDDANTLAWGRVIEGKSGEIMAIVEQKDATEEQRQVKKLNAGFYCFDYNFLKTSINKLIKSPVSGEYYLTDLIKMAIDRKLLVLDFPVSFEFVGIGINTLQQFEESQGLYKKR